MSDPVPQMKPQDTIVYLLGELKGEMRSTRETVAASSNSQAIVNAENTREHESFRETLAAHAQEITTIKAAQPVRVSTWSKAGVIIAVPASVVALVGFIFVYLHP
jgi:hypothetical protein